MGYRLRVPAEIGDWLTGLRESQPEAAREVGASLAALMAADQVPGPPLSLPADAEDEPAAEADPRAAVDYAYQDLLEELQTVRRHVASTATARHRMELQLIELSGESETPPARLAAVDGELQELRRREERLATLSQAIHLEVDHFRATKEAAKAAYTAATAGAELRKLLVDSGESKGAEIAAAEQALRDAAQRITELLADALALKRKVRSVWSGDGGRGAARSARERSPSWDHPDLMQLKADPLGADIRILFAIDPPGTATLLTVLEGPDAIAEDWAEAATAAGMLLEVIRDAGWPPYAAEPGGGGREFAGPGQFRHEFFAASDDDIAARAAQIGARRSLAELRERSGLSATDVAGVTGISEPRLAAIEEGDLRHASLHELTQYLRAVGATLDVSAGLEGQSHRLA